MIIRLSALLPELNASQVLATNVDDLLFLAKAKEATEVVLTEKEYCYFLGFAFASGWLKFDSSDFNTTLGMKITIEHE